jgi:hypothetical protein
MSEKHRQRKKRLDITDPSARRNIPAAKTFLHLPAAPPNIPGSHPFLPARLPRNRRGPGLSPRTAKIGILE